MMPDRASWDLPYSENLCKKIVEALALGTAKSEAARSFGVGRSSVKRYARMAAERKPLTPKKRPGTRPTVGRRRQATLRVQKVVKVRGCELLYLPPYSPGFNTIEQAFYKVKELVRRAETRTRAALIEAMGQTLRAITARVLLDHCGYRTLGQLL